MSIHFSDLDSPAQTKVVDRANLKMLAAVFIVAGLLYLFTGGTARAMYVDAGTSVGTSSAELVAVEEDSPHWNAATMGNLLGSASVDWAHTYEKRNWKGHAETMNVTFSCVRAVDNGSARWSVKNTTDNAVTLYAGSGCHGRTVTVGAHRWKADTGFGYRWVKFQR